MDYRSLLMESLALGDTFTVSMFIHQQLLFFPNAPDFFTDPAYPTILHSRDWLSNLDHLGYEIRTLSA
jgi:hypothetical protein